MARTIPTDKDYLIIGDELYKVICVDLDDEIWVEGKVVDRMDVTTGEYILKDIEAWDTHYFDDSYIGYFEVNKKYSYIPDYYVNYRKLKLTRLARKLYNIPDSFTGDLYYAEPKK